MAKKTVSILDFGAVANTNQLQTKNIQSAIDDCFLSGGGVVEVPEGTFLTGGLRLRSNVTLHLLKNAIIKGSRNPEDYFGYLTDEVEPLGETEITDGVWSKAEAGKIRDYRFMRIPGSRWNNALIRAIHAENIAIIGEEGSIIDGSDCYDEKGEENYRGPHAINFFFSKNITLKGYTVKDSANWANSAFYCKNISAENITALAGHDGIHITSCENAIIKDCHFFTGDDCVAGFSNINVTITNCELNSACSALRFGGTNVVIEKCHMYGPCKYLFRGSLTTEEKKNGIKPSTEGHRNNMLSAFTFFSDFSVDIPYQPGNIIIRDCQIDYADRFLHYNYSGNEMWQQNRPLDNITFENIKATDVSMPLTAYGDPDVPVKLTMKNIDISMRKGFEDVDFMHVAHFDVTLDNFKIANYKGNALVKAWTPGKLKVTNLDCDISEENYLKDMDEEFVCQPI